MFDDEIIYNHAVKMHLIYEGDPDKLTLDFFVVDITLDGISIVLLDVHPLVAELRDIFLSVLLEDVEKGGRIDFVEIWKDCREYRV